MDLHGEWFFPGRGFLVSEGDIGQFEEAAAAGWCDVAGLVPRAVAVWPLQVHARRYPQVFRQIDDGTTFSMQFRHGADIAMLNPYCC